MHQTPLRAPANTLRAIQYVTLSPGDRFRVIGGGPVPGMGPSGAQSHLVGRIFRLLRTRRRKVQGAWRLYAECVELQPVRKRLIEGGQHTLFVAGEPYVPRKNPDVLLRPCELEKLPAVAEPEPERKAR